MTLPDERTRAIVKTEKFLMDMAARKVPGIPEEISDLAKSLLRHYPTEFDLELAYDMSRKITNDISAFPFGPTPKMLQRTKLSVKCAEILRDGDVKDIISFFMSLVKDVGGGIELFPSLLNAVAHALVDLRDRGHLVLTPGIMIANSHFSILSGLAVDERISSESREFCAAYLAGLPGSDDEGKKSNHLFRGFHGFIAASGKLSWA